MDFIDNLIQTLFDIIDNLFWFSPGIGPRKIKKLNPELFMTIQKKLWTD